MFASVRALPGCVLRKARTSRLVLFLMISPIILLLVVMSGHVLQGAAPAKEARLSEVDVHRGVRKIHAQDAQHDLTKEEEQKRARSNDMGIPSEFFPVQVQNPGTPEASVVFCRIDFSSYHAQPSLMPMFRDVRQKLCKDQISKRVSDLVVSPSALQPSGFIFHVSRCGSTMLANMLASDPENLVFSESGALPEVVLHCDACSEQEKIKLMRLLVAAHGNSLVHKRLFFKFQSALGPHISLFRKAFPSVPWIYVYRDPVEVMVSLLAGGTHAPCLRARSNPAPAVRALLGEALAKATNEQFCAAHLNYLFGVARNAALSGGGLVVDYSTLVPVFLDHVLPNLFHAPPSEQTRAAMLAQTQLYSKSRAASAVAFKSDVEEKQRMASSEIRKWAIEFVAKPYATLQGLTRRGLGQTDLAPTKRARAPLADDSFYPHTINEDESSIRNYIPYPPLQPLRGLLEHWAPDDPNIPADDGIAEGTLERFDFMNLTQRARAELLRHHEVPFMLFNVPEVDAVVQKWTHEYLSLSFGTRKQKIHQSRDNHFPYYNRALAVRNPSYKPHTNIVDMTYAEWLVAAEKAKGDEVDSEHFYFQTSDFGNKWILDDLKLFMPRRSWFIVNSRLNRGINCRFGSRGIIAENHYDGGRNFVAMLKGAKRYVLLPPEECDKLYLYPRSHPEGRHSKYDWSKINWTEAPLMANAQATQVIVREGEVLYIPSYWFHYIVSLGISAQCNSRSGDALRGRDALKQCGFY